MKPTEMASPAVNKANKFQFQGALRRRLADADMVYQAIVLSNKEREGMAAPTTPDVRIHRDHCGFCANRVTTIAVIPI